MNWIEQWRALAARIDGLVRAGEFLIGAFKVNSSDSFQVFEKSFWPNLVAIRKEIDQLGNDHQAELSPPAHKAIQRYVSSDRKPFGGGNPGPINIQLLAPLAAFRSEFEYLIRDAEVEQRALVELSFEHLRRQIVVDADVKKKWKNAFKGHETKCEKLGAVHLLGHAIWAFKFHAIGGATDLIFGDPIEQFSTIARRTARAMVLTEWKLVRDQKDLTKKATEARKQVEQYTAGVLGDIELKSTRYIVLVTEAQLKPVSDISEGGVMYRHISIPVRPKVPSKSALSKSS